VSLREANLAMGNVCDRCGTASSALFWRLGEEARGEPDQWFCESCKAEEDARDENEWTELQEAGE
jgi:hypothetical protein